MEERVGQGDVVTPSDGEHFAENGRADLHVHSTYSDGVHSPEVLVKKAREAGLAAIAITDHDNLSGLDEALDWGRSLSVDVIPGIEFSVAMSGKDVHILAYYCDHTNRDLQDYLTFFQRERVKRAERIVEKLNRLNLPLTMDAVLDQAGEGSVGRPHIANALVENGLTGTYHEAFAKYIGWGGPAFEKKFQLTIADTFRLIASAGGLSFLAHPGWMISEPEIVELIKLGLDGIEVVHPSHSESQRKDFRNIVNQYFLLESGGSDYHGGRRGDDAAFGLHTVPLQVVETMRRRLFS